jgi:uncharacterized membrane protein
MNPASTVHATRRTLVVIIIVGLVLGLFGLFIGIGIPGAVMSFAGWAVVIAGIIWLIISYTQRSAAHSRPSSWRPGDNNTE